VTQQLALPSSSFINHTLSPVNALMSLYTDAGSSFECAPAHIMHGEEERFPYEGEVDIYVDI